MMDNKWWWAAGFIVGGLILGTIAGIVARRILDREARRPAVQQAARPAAALLFWLFVAAGLVAAVASASPDTLKPIPSDLLAWLPRVGVAGLILIGGFVAASVLSTGVAKSAARATGNRQPMLESTTRFAVISAAAVLALTQLGVDTTILNILVAAIAFGIALALAGIAIVGGREIAQSVAGGKAVSSQMTIGARLTMGGHTGTLDRLTATHATLTTENGDSAIIPLRSASTDDIIIHAGSLTTRDFRHDV